MAKAGTKERAKEKAGYAKKARDKKGGTAGFRRSVKELRKKGR